MGIKKKRKISKQNRRNNKARSHKSVSISKVQLIGLNCNNEPVCMINQVSNKHLKALQKEGHTKLQLGDWFASAGQCYNLKIFGPFDDVENALNFCKDTYNISNFSSLPSW